MISIEQQIVNALVERLALIRVGRSVVIEATGETYAFQNTIRTAVDGRVTDFNEAELPAANVFTPSSEAGTIGMAHFDHDINVVIILHVAQSMAQKAIRTLRQDVYAAIGADEKLGVDAVISVGDPARVTKCIQMQDFIGSEQITLPVRYRSSRWGV